MLALQRMLSEGLAKEVLAFVTSSVASIAAHWDYQIALVSFVVAKYAFEALRETYKFITFKDFLLHK